MGAVHQLSGKQLLSVNHDPLKTLIVLRNKFTVHPSSAHLLVENFNKEHGTNLKIVSHSVADAAFHGNQFLIQAFFMNAGFFPVDASIAYEKPGTELGKEIVFSPQGESRVVLPTGKYKGEKDVALVALGLSSKDFKADGQSVVLDIPDSRLIAVPNFPVSSGFYAPHTETGVPHITTRIDMHSGGSYLRRLNTSAYVGLIARCHRASHGYYGDVVFAIAPFSTIQGIVTEVPDADIAKIQALIAPNTPVQTNLKSVIEVAGISFDSLSSSYKRATEAVSALAGKVDAQVLGPIEAFISQFKSTFEK